MTMLKTVMRASRQAPFGRFPIKTHRLLHTLPPRFRPSTATAMPAFGMNKILSVPVLLELPSTVPWKKSISISALRSYSTESDGRSSARNGTSSTSPIELYRLFNHSHPHEHYENLELQPGPLATRKRIKESFQRLALQWHPDRNTAPEAKAKFAAISASYRLLVDTANRRVYDRWIDDVKAYQQQVSADIPAQQRRSWDDANTSPSDTPLWSRGSTSRRGRVDRSTDYHDTRAHHFQQQRRAAANGDQGEHQSGFTEGAASSSSSTSSNYSSSTSSSSTAPHFGQTETFRGQYTSPLDPSWHRARVKERDEHARVGVRRQFLQEDRFKTGVAWLFIFALFLRQVASS